VKKYDEAISVLEIALEELKNNAAGTGPDSGGTCRIRTAKSIKGAIALLREADSLHCPHYVEREAAH
jgi:hypothetical protein